MTNKHLSYTNTNSTKSQIIGANEKAMLDKIGNATLKKLATKILQIKVRLQFTGWLQYVLPGLLAVVFFLVATIVGLVGNVLVASPFIFIGSLFFIVFIFDLITVKFRLRFPEALPKRNDNLDLFDLMRVRRSCRSFQTRKLTSADYDELMGYVHLHSKAPTIGKAPIRFEYISAPLTVWPVVNATQFLVAIAPSQYNRLAVIDVGRTLQKIVTDATRMGLGTCWIGPGTDQASVIQHLGNRYNAKEDHIICVCAIGYKSWYMPMFLRIFNAVSKERLPLSSLFFADAYLKKPLNIEESPFKQFGRNYEICQWAPSSYNGQTTRCVAVMEQKNAEKGERNEEQPRLARFDFYAATASRYYAAVAVGIWCANWELGCEVLDIHGHFAVLSPQERGIDNEKAYPPLPKYDVSWILDE